MCNPIASKIIERKNIMEISSQPNQQLVDRRIDDDADNSNNSGSNNTTVNRSEEVPPPSSAAAAAGSSSSDTIEDNSEECSKNNIDKIKHAMDTIREYDVLMGRGSGPNRHSGNIHFRAIVGEVFDEFLSKHGSNRNSIGECGTDILRIDPSTKNRLAQAVLDKITLEKKGRFLQKLYKKELLEATEKGDFSNLIKARAMYVMDVAMSTATDNLCIDGKAAAPVDSSHEKVGANAFVYYKIIPEKQILAKIKQTFRFLRDQNEASNAEKLRQRCRRVVAATAGCGVPREQQLLSASSLGGIGRMQIPGGISRTSTMAATYAMMERMGANMGMTHPLNTLSVNPSPLPDQLNYTNSTNINGNNSMYTSNNANIWAATRNLNNIVVPPMTMNAIKSMNHTSSPSGAMNISTVASRLLCDLPQPKRVLSTSDTNGSSNKIASPIDNSTKRLLEELTLSRLVNLQKQREDTINAYLAMERSSGRTAGSVGIGNTVSQIDSVGGPTSMIPSQHLQRLFNMNAANAAGPPNSLPMISGRNTAALGGRTNSASELSLLLQLNNSNNGRNTNCSPGNHSLRAFNKF